MGKRGSSYYERENTASHRFNEGGIKGVLKGVKKDFQGSLKYKKKVMKDQANEPKFSIWSGKKAPSSAPSKPKQAHHATRSGALIHTGSKSVANMMAGTKELRRPAVKR